MIIKKGLINQLPIELIYYIQKFSYNCPPIALLKDIKQFNSSLELLNTYYFNYWLQFDSDTEYSDWILNDLLGYANNFKAMMICYEDSFYNIFKKHNQINNKDDVINFLKYYEKLSVKSQIKFLWGLYTFDQRLDFIKKRNIII
jgi:hypothetical protein